MSWAYRVMRVWAGPDGDEWYEIHEVYDDGMFTASSIRPGGATVEELRADLERMLKALDAPVLEYKP